jgi:hypothetical protein
MLQHFLWRFIIFAKKGADMEDIVKLKLNTACNLINLDSLSTAYCEEIETCVQNEAKRVGKTKDDYLASKFPGADVKANRYRFEARVFLDKLSQLSLVI